MPLLRLVLTLVLCWAATAVAARNDPARKPSAFMTERMARFAEWQQQEARGQEPQKLWECAACPILNVQPNGGVFIGAYEWEAGAKSNEGPPVEVTLPANFAVGRFEVTRGEFAAFAAATHRKPHGKCLSDRRKPGSWEPDARATFLDPGFTQADDHPVVCVSFEDAQAYVAWLNSQTSGGYRLLTEAEWEYVTRGYSHDIYAWGNSPANACLFANFAAPATTGIACPDPWARTAPVGQLTINQFDLFDLSGNASEWVDGCFVAGKQPASMDPNCKEHIEKGGSWKSQAADLRPARRTGHEASYREDSLGFRVAKTLPDSKSPLDSAAAYQRRGRALIHLAQYEDARSDFTHALEMKPGDASLLADRAEAHHWLQDEAHELEDVQAALAANPDEPLALSLEGSRLVFDKKDRQGGLALLERAGAAAPWRPYIMGELAGARYVAGDEDGALTASNGALQFAPRYPQMFELQLRILTGRRDWRGVLGVARRYMTLNYFSSEAQADAAQAFYRLGLRLAALVTMDRAIHIDANVNNYLLRQSMRASDDLEGRRADLVAALKVDPNSLGAQFEMANVDAESGNHEAAVEGFTNLLKAKLEGWQIADTHLKRGIEYSKLGKAKLADADFAASIEPGTEPGRWNDLCWELTVQGIEFERATRACKRALELKPQSAAILDSQAWLLLRQNRFDEAIVAFDAALKVSPSQAASLYGRGLARQQRCGCRDGIDDLNAALAQAPASPDAYSFTGFTPRGTLTPPWSDGGITPAVP